MTPKIAIIMGSKSDYSTMKETEIILELFNISFETSIVSAHRTPDFMFEFAEKAASRGIEIIIAGAGGAAHLPGMVASNTILPVLGVPIQSKELKGIDSLLSIAQMPAGIPVGTLAIGIAGAKNAALLACQILALSDANLRGKLYEYRKKQTEKVLNDVL